METKKVEPTETTRWQYTEDMGEISGFGGGYEMTCRNMVWAGLRWFEENPKADPVFQGFKGVYGILTDNNPDAEALTKAIIAGADGDATGAMHQATVSHVLAIHRLGWDEYAKQMRERK